MVIPIDKWPADKVYKKYPPRPWFERDLYEYIMGEKLTSLKKAKAYPQVPMPHNAIINHDIRVVGAKAFTWREYFNIARVVNHNVTMELVWTIIPIVVLILIAVPSMQLLYFIENPDNMIGYSFEISIHVIGHQWFWSYEYISYQCRIFTFIETSSVIRPFMIVDDILKECFDSYMLFEDDVFEVNGLRLLEVDFPLILPKNTKINFFITSTDVLHSWAVPSLGIKVDAVPGRLSVATTNIQHTGILYGQCSEICGVGHGFMPIKLIVV
jgi:heme/copper-type cytochrome/quinol oxidase subunit 2